MQCETYDLFKLEDPTKTISEGLHPIDEHVRGEYGCYSFLHSCLQVRVHVSRQVFTGANQLVALQHLSRVVNN